MIHCFMPFSPEFPYEEAKECYERYQNEIDDNQSFEDLLKNTMFFAFVNDEDKKLWGCIYFYKLEDDLTYVNAFATRHHHGENVKWLKWAVSGFKCNIYAKTKHRHAVLCLLRAGFKKIDDNLYEYERK